MRGAMSLPLLFEHSCHVRYLLPLRISVWAPFPERSMDKLLLHVRLSYGLCAAIFNQGSVDPICKYRICASLVHATVPCHARMLHR
jgi:hypothetical protein